jgi:hypothetical protein
MFRIDGNESIDARKHSLSNGLLTFSTPEPNYGRFQYNAELSAFNLYKSLLQFNSTPKSNQKNIRKPRVNFHSIDDIVNGGKTSDEDSEHVDSGYQSSSLVNISNGITKENIIPIEKKKDSKNRQSSEYANNSENDAENEENIEIKVSLKYSFLKI